MKDLKEIFPKSNIGLLDLPKSWHYSIF